MTEMKGWIALMAVRQSTQEWVEIAHWHEHPKEHWVKNAIKIPYKRRKYTDFMLVRVLPYTKLSLENN